MDIEATLRGSLLGELNNHMNNYPAFVRPLLGMVIGAVIMQILNLVMRKAQDKAEKARDNWDNFWRRFGRSRENSVVFYFEETKAEKETFVSPRYSSGFIEVASYVMGKVEQVGECYRIQDSCGTDGAYLAKFLQNHKLYPSCDIMIDMETDATSRDNVQLLKSKMVMRSRSHTIAELHKTIKKIIDEVTLNAHDGSIWAFMTSYDTENGISVRRMKLETHKTWDHLIMNTRQKNILYTYLNRFSDKSWYIQQGIPYKATFLLYGPPGTGKTTLIKVLAEQYKRHVVLFSLRGVKNNNFVDMFYNYRFKDNLDNFIFVFEDVDADTKAVWSRDFKNTIKPKKDELPEDNDSLVNSAEMKVLRQGGDSKLDLATILQALDGVVENTGLMVVATTNHYERLDSAFIRRFHCRLELSYCCRETANMITFKYFGRHFTDEEWEKYHEKITKLTPNNMIELSLGSSSWEFFLNEL